MCPLAVLSFRTSPTAVPVATPVAYPMTWPRDPRSATRCENVRAKTTASTAAMAELASFKPRAAMATLNVHMLTLSNARPNMVAISVSIGVDPLLR